ncbi:MAG TPA: urea ABC transporter permease subunit UrtB [Alphaproteobacteria bacterium]|nr:urea ABC transporter permease subunit UrtB [Alphaproteobacteria bacterium]
MPAYSIRRLIAAMALAAVAYSPAILRAQEAAPPEAAVEAPASQAAPSFERLVQQLGLGGFDDKIKAVETLTATGDARAVAALQAMMDGNLYTQEDKVYIAESGARDAKLKDAITGEAATITASGASRVTVNNRLRGILRGALGALTLFSPDPAQRASGAAALFRSRPAEMAEPLAAALAKETDPAAKREMEHSLAAIRLANPGDEAQRIAAAALLGNYADPETRALLTSLQSQEMSPALKATVASALAKVERSLAFWGVFNNIFQGVSLGSVLLLAAIGLAITFGVMGVINMAHGEMIMIGAYTTYMVQELFRAYLPGYTSWSMMFSVPAAFLVTGAIGVIIERGVIRFLYGRALETLLATWGISLILQQGVRTIFGPTNREVATPPWMSGAWEVVGGLTLTYNRMAIVIFSLVVLAMIALLMRYSSFGLHMRAVTQNRRMASSLGIRTGKVDALTFGLGSGIAGIAGVALSQISNVSPNLGQSFIIDSFMVVVFGGVGNLWGTLVGAFSLGLVNKFLEPYAGAVLGKIFVLIAIILFIQKRPRGLFALKGRSVEA